MRFDFIGLSERYVNTAAVGLPTGNSGRIFFIRVLDTFEVLLFVLVLGSVGIGVASEPEVLNELIAFFVGFKGFERLSFLIGYDVTDILVEPVLINTLQLFFPLALIAVFALVFVLVLFLSDDARKYSSSQDTY